MSQVMGVEVNLRDYGPRVSFAVAALIAAMLGPSLAASADVAVDLSFASLPSAQGWSYGGSVPETAIQLSGGVLSYSTIASGGTAYYSVQGLDWGNDPFELTFTMKTTEMSEYWGYYPFSAAVTLGNDGYFAAVGVAPGYVAVDTDIISPAGYVAAGLDNASAFHQYRMQGTFGVDWTLFRDDVPVLTGGWTAAPGNNGIWLGDGTSGSDAAASISQFSARTVPEPATLAALVLGGLAMARRRR